MYLWCLSASRNFDCLCYWWRLNCTVKWWLYRLILCYFICVLITFIYTNKLFFTDRRVSLSFNLSFLYVSANYVVVGFLGIDKMLCDNLPVFCFLHRTDYGSFYVSFPYIFLLFLISTANKYKKQTFFKWCYTHWSACM